jgi:hypothetical protein
MNVQAAQKYSWLALLLFSMMISITGMSLVFPASARADGGAPNLAYVAGTSHGVSVIDIGQQKVTKTLTVPGDPHMVYLTTDGRFLYVTEPQENRLAVFSTSTSSIICTASIPGQPTLVTFDIGTNLVYVAGSGAPTVTALDAATCQKKFTITTNGPVHGMAVAVVGSGLSGSTGNQLWVAADTLNAYDDIKGQQIASVTVAGQPHYVTAPSGATIYVTTSTGSVDAVDLVSHHAVPLISGGTYGPMDYDANTGEVYVPDMQHDQIVVLTPVNVGFKLPAEPNHIIKLGVSPQSVAITSDGQLGFVALSNGNVVMLDIPGRQIITTIFVGGTPHFIITGLYPPLVGTTPQQASLYGTLINIGAYVLVIALFAVPVTLFIRYARAGKQKEIQ